MKRLFGLVSIGLTFFLFIGSTLVIGAEKNIPPSIAKQLNEMRETGIKKGWTFEVGYSKSLEIPLENKTGLIVPRNWRHNAQFVQPVSYVELPKKFDWRDYQGGGLTPIYNQGSCGSCWAFATTAVFADLIWIRDRVKKDLAEQYLVSCNNYGYGCGGGWWVHDMYERFGMVPEASFPYEAEDVTCPANLPHQEKLESWSFVGSELDTYPTTEELKQAIYTYGPISVAVAAVGSFSAYSGGIFNDCSSSEINHAVNLVGWNDDGGYWIMRNSWGADWGENGFMRIKYKCSSIGYAASFAAYKPSCTPQPKADTGPDVTVKTGQSVKLGRPSSVSQTYSWSPTDGLDNPNIAQPSASPSNDTVYTLTAKTSCGKATNTVKVTVVSDDGGTDDDDDTDDDGTDDGK